MRATLVVPVESLRGKFGSDYYARVMYGKVIIQRCPRRWKKPTAAQIEARKRFTEKYARGREGRCAVDCPAGCRSAQAPVDRYAGVCGLGAGKV